MQNARQANQKSLTFVIFAIDFPTAGRISVDYCCDRYRKLQCAELDRETADIIAAYVSSNSIPASELPWLIAKVHATIVGLSTGVSSDGTGGAEVEKPTPSQIRKSIRDEGLISFIDGKSYKTLKRHLTKHGLDPRAYRERYGLPDNYPMTAPSYAKRRSALAKAMGLGVPGAQGVQRRTGT